MKIANNLRKYVLDGRKRTEPNEKVQKTVADTHHTTILLGTVVTNPSEFERYKLLNAAIEGSEPYKPIFLNDFAPTDRRRRFEYLEGIKTSTKCQKFSYTGCSTHLHWIWKIPVDDSESVTMSKYSEITSNLRSELPVYHSRAAKREFISLFGQCTGLKPGLLRNIYRRLTGDASSSCNATEAEIDKRVKQMLDTEDADVIWDLRNSNSRSDEYDEYLA